MFKFYFVIFAIVLLTARQNAVYSQVKSIQLRSIDSSLSIIDTTKNVYLKIGLLGKVSFAYQYINFNKSILYADSAIKLSKENNYKYGLAKGYNFLGLTYQTIGKLDLALQNYLRSLNINKNGGVEKETGKNLNNIASVLVTIGDYEGAKKYVLEAYEVNKRFKNANSLAISLSIMSDIYIGQNDFEQGLENLKEARKLKKDNSSIFDEGFYGTKLGELYFSKGDLKLSENAFYKVLAYEGAESDQITKSLLGLSKIKLLENKQNESEAYLNQALKTAQISNAQVELIAVYDAFVNLNIKQNNFKKALNFHQLKDNLKDSVLGYNTSGQISSSLNKIITDEMDKENDELRLLAQFKEAELKKQNTISILLVAGISLILFLGILLYLNFHSKNKAYQKLADANTTIKKQNEDLENLIALRTETIRNKNEKLKELAYFNSHQIRKHTANILGLILVSSFENEKDKYFAMIEKEAKELENIIEEVNHMTSD